VAGVEADNSTVVATTTNGEGMWGSGKEKEGGKKC
jgi:hypothetical protein